MQRDSILSAVERYYSAKFAEHGASARGVDWNSEESQVLRFEQLTHLFAGEIGEFSVNDLGCGYGALARFLQDRSVRCRYTGYELSEAMLENCRASFGPRTNIEFSSGWSMGLADYSLASGIFNVRFGFSDDEWGRYVDEMLDELARASRRGFAFNMLSSHSDTDRRRPDLYYADPTAVLDMCKTRYSKYVSVLHDYPLWEFTTIVRFRP